MTTIIFTLLIVVLGVIVSGATRSELSRLFDISAWRSNTKGVNWPLVSVLTVFLLLVTILPEVRVFLMFIDAVGLDFFVLLLTIQCREYFGIFRDYLLAPLWRKLKRSGPVPFDFLAFPTLNVMREYPYLSASSVVALVVSVSFMVVLSPVLLAY